MNTTLSHDEWEQLSAWFDGELPSEQAGDVARRVADDPAWQAAASSIRNVDRALDAWPAPAAEADLARRVLAHVQRSKPSGVIRIARWLAPVAAAAAACVLMIVLLNPGEPTSTPLASDPAEAVDSFAAEGMDTLNRLGGETLADRIGPLAPRLDSRDWSQLNEAERSRFRENTWAFLRKNVAEQQELLDQIEVDAWMKAVVHSFTPAEQEKLNAMPAAERAKVWLQRRDELQQEGQL